MKQDESYSQSRENCGQAKLTNLHGASTNHRQSAVNTPKQPIRIRVKPKSAPADKHTAFEQPMKGFKQEETAQEANAPASTPLITEENWESVPSFYPRKQEVSKGDASPIFPAEHLLEEPCKNKKRKTFGKWWKPVLFILLGVVLAATLAIVILQVLPGNETTHSTSAETVEILDIHEIYGCPELFGLEFGMTVEETTAAIQIDDVAATAFTVNGSTLVSLPPKAQYTLYDLPVQDFLCSFDDGALQMVVLEFDKETVTYEQVIGLYTQIYGQPSESNATRAIWRGNKTAITLFAESDEDAYVVRYLENPNQRFRNLSFDGSAIDPCGFLTDNYAFDKTASYFIDGLTEGSDYSKKIFSDSDIAAFTKYELYPHFEYMGIQEGDTAISFDIDGSKNTVDICSYLFALDRQTAADKMEHIKATLEQEYGAFDDCSYTSLLYSESENRDISFQEAISMINSDKQGLYYIGWSVDGYRITLHLELNPTALYCKGYVAFAIQPPHEHSYAVKSETAPSCEQDGLTEYECDCGDRYTETVQAMEHSFSAATCTKAKTCAFCGKTDGSAQGHNIVDCVCTRCQAIVLTEDDLQGTWVATWHIPGSYRKMSFSGSSFYREDHLIMSDYGYTDHLVFTGTYTINGNVLTIYTTVVNSRITDDGTEVRTYTVDTSYEILEYTQNMIAMDTYGPFYKQ